jgi:hypothetical protein
MKLTVMTSSEKKSGRPTAFAAPIRSSVRNRECDYRDESRSHMPEENNAYQGDNNAFFDQFFPKRFDGSLDDPATIVGRNDLDPLGQRRLKFLQLIFNA